MKYLQLKCKPLDELLGGGIEKGTITEVYGEPGSGKTNLCLQAARECVSNGKNMIFIDTEGVSLERLKQICQKNYDFKKIIDKILFYNPDSFESQEKIICEALKLKDIDLIIIDTLNLFYRVNLEDDKEACMRSFLRQMSNLQLGARKNDIFVIVSEQVYTDKNGDIKPFTHRETEHMIKTSIKLEKTGIGKRKATIMKHRSQPEGNIADFIISAHGLE